MKSKSNHTKSFMIYEELVEKIQNGTYQPNTKLPTEHEFMQQYEVARGTIREALQMLYQNGYIQKIQGKGSVVLDIRRKYNFPITELVSFKQIAKAMGGTSRTILQELSLIKPDAFIQTELNVSTAAEIWKVVRTREIDGEKIILDVDYFNKQYITFLTKEICEDSIYEYIENELQLSIGFAKKEILVEEPTEMDRTYLDLEGFPNVVVVKNHVYLEDITLFQYTESRHRPDKFRFVDFARRFANYSYPNM
ncbi:trehalose operon repressor [Fodinisporobacter ferrooxydans]|uniref:Trehalose operon repressor n=1 Tax=Fodinisporobacter ferrooxydans TaxID=2901836 RepID=A0ABY4CM27_9BACL|nr:trehalose operon repressor [Alicyclobacillaceae bacterium MYW30-H2]